VCTCIDLLCVQIGALRTAVNNYHPNHPEFVRQIDQTLGTTSAGQRENLHLQHELAVSIYYNVRCSTATRQLLSTTVLKDSMPVPCCSCACSYPYPDPVFVCLTL